MENGDICETNARVSYVLLFTPLTTLKYYFSNSAADTHTSTVGVDDADSQRAVLHVALELEHGALSSRHGQAAQLSCEQTQ